MSKRKDPRTKFTQEIADEICERLSEGEPLRQICRDPHMPKWRTVYDWINRDEEFAARIARARELGYDAIAESALEIADDGTNDWMEKRNRKGETIGYELNGEHVQRSKLRVHTRLQLLAKWSPKKYGDRHQVDLNGRLSMSEMTDDEIRAELAALAAAGVIPAELAQAGQTQDETPDDDISDLL